MGVAWSSQVVVGVVGDDIPDDLDVDNIYDLDGVELQYHCDAYVLGITIRRDDSGVHEVKSRNFYDQDKYLEAHLVLSKYADADKIKVLHVVSHDAW